MITEHDRSQGAAPVPAPFLQHAEIRARAQRLEEQFRELAREVGAAVDDGSAREAHRLFHDFRAVLLDHLVAEEQSGILDMAIEDAPRLSREADRLRDEHGAMRQHVEALLGEARQGRWPEVYAGFVVFHRILLAHDRAESELVQRAYLEDIGGRG